MGDVMPLWNMPRPGAGANEPRGSSSTPCCGGKLKIVALVVLAWLAWRKFGR
jgi:hypothetical protein